MLNILQTIFANWFWHKKFLIFILIPMKFKPNGPIDILTWVWEMIWQRTGDKLLIELIMNQFTDTCDAMGIFY